jgi:PAS domain S-box-containing protein
MNNTKTILLVEDEARLATEQEQTLRKYGHEVVVVATGEKAVERARTIPNIDLILMDINLGGGMDGAETAEIILGEKDIPLLFLLSSARPEEAEKAGRVASYGYVVKELGETVLTSAINMAFKLNEAHREIKEREEEHRLLFESASSAIFIAQDNMMKIVNHALTKMSGYSVEALTTRPFTSFIHPDDIVMIADRYTRRLRGEPVESNYVFRIVTAEGVPRWVEIRSVLTSWKGRAATLNYLIDVTERRLAQEALKASEEKYRQIFEGATEGIYQTTPDGRFLNMNPAFAKMFGYTSPEEMITTVTNIGQERYVDPMDRDRLVQMSSQYNNVEGFETEVYRKDGSRFWISINTHAVRDAEGNILHLEGTATDITERRRAEQEILGERSKLKTLSDNAPFGMALIDSKGRLTYINRKFTEIFGYSLSDVPDGKAWLRKIYPESGYRHTVISAWREDLRDAGPGERRPRVFTATCKDGAQKTIQFIFSILASGECLFTYEDITELRQLENQLRQAQKTEAIGTLAGGIAHDFNNILTALMGYAALIQLKMDTSDPLRSYVDEIFVASQKAVDLTRSLLTFSRQQSVTLVPLDMNHTIRAAEKLLRRLLTEDIELCTSLTGDDTIVMADKSQVDQILFNLVTNARDSMPKGGTLTIETAITIMYDTFTKTHGFGEAGKYVEITVSDTGTGMDDVTKEKIFDPFFTTKEIGKGTGLGLATVYGIVKRHSGYITVESTRDQGTTFHVYLPAIERKVDERRDVAVPIKTGKETVLIAEDNEDVRRVMREALREHGYVIIEATDGQDAVETFKQHQNIDLIVIDSVMPKKNGREAYEEIRRMDPHVKVLFTSGYTKDVILDKGIEEKEFNFIAKPLLLDKFLEKVREVLDG